MSENIKEEEKKECCCFLKCEYCKKFLIVAVGTFIGVFCALSLFAALHKPPMMMPMQPGAFFKPDAPAIEHHWGDKPHPHGHFKGDHFKGEKPQRPDKED